MLLKQIFHLFELNDLRVNMVFTTAALQHKDSGFQPAG